MEKSDNDSSIISIGTFADSGSSLLSCASAENSTSYDLHGEGSVDEDIDYDDLD